MRERVCESVLVGSMRAQSVSSDNDTRHMLLAVAGADAGAGAAAASAAATAY